MDGAAIMYKIIACLLSFMLVATVLFDLRRARLNVTANSAHLFHQIGRRRHILWDLQTRLSAQTNPIVLTKRIKALDARTAANAANTTAPASVTPMPVNTVPDPTTLVH